MFGARYFSAWCWQAYYWQAVGATTATRLQRFLVSDCVTPFLVTDKAPALVAVDKAPLFVVSGEV